MSDDLFPVSTLEMLNEAKRELSARERLYPSWINDKKIRAVAAEKRLRIMRAIVKVLEELHATN